MSEPLTPPPTSAIEIQDAARSSLPLVETDGAEPIVTDPPTQDATAVAAVPPQAQFSTPYHFLFPSLAEYAGNSDYKELVRQAERGDLNADNDDHISRLLLVAPMVLSYLILDDLPPAKFALSRLPPSLAKLPLSQNLLSLLSAVWKKQYDQVYTRAGHVTALVQREPPLPNFDLGPLVVRLVQIFIESFQRKTFALISKAYSSIPLSLAQIYLGMPTDQLLTVAEQHKWSFNGESQVLSPTTSGPSVSDTFAFSSSIATLNSVADSLILESS